MQDEFSWVIDQQLAGMPRPGISGSLAADIAFLAEQGVGLLVSLTGSPPDSSMLTEYGIESLHLPILDFQPPTLQQQVAFVNAASEVMGSGGRVGVHCTAGMGRTGTMLATFLVFLGSSAEDAIASVRDLRPGSIETPAQESAIRAYGDFIENAKPRVP